MIQPVPPGRLKGHIHDKLQEQIVVKSYILQIDPLHGARLQVAPSSPATFAAPRSAPIGLFPSPWIDFLDREQASCAVCAALESATHVELSGQGGIGKTTVLRQVAQRISLDMFPDGVVYLSARRRALTDLLQSLYDAFYESVSPFKPTDAQICQALQNKRALILLDDVELARDQVEALMASAPGCVFCLTSSEPRLWGVGQAIRMQGLLPEFGVKLIEWELGRALYPEEHPAAQRLCAALEGHPLSLLQAVAAARQGNLALAELAQIIQTSGSIKGMLAWLLTTLSHPEQRVMAVLAALDNLPLSAASLSALTGMVNIAPILEKLQERYMLQPHNALYRLPGDLCRIVQQDLDPAPWAERALHYFAGWVEQPEVTGERLLEEADAILHVLAWAVKARHRSEALRLARAIESSLILGKRWGAWEQVLRCGLEAARALRDRSAEAWALHQMGTRALCLGESNIARAYLIRAMGWRESLRNRTGAYITRHNLSLLLPPPPPRPPTGSGVFSRPASRLPQAIQRLFAVAPVVLMLIGLGFWFFIQVPTFAMPLAQVTPTLAVTQTPGLTPALAYTATPIPTFTRTRTPTYTRTPMPTSTHTATRTPTSTHTPTSPPRLPDLVATLTFGKLTKNADNQMVLPVRLVVKNQGEMAAGIFQVAIYCTQVKAPPAPPIVAQSPAPFIPCLKIDSRDLFVFVVPKQSAPSPATTDSLVGGSSVTFSGSVTLSPLLEGAQVTIEAEADSCDDKTAQPNCRVAESNEGNNTAKTMVTLVIPASAPTPTPTSQSCACTCNTATPAPTPDHTAPSIKDVFASLNLIRSHSRCGSDSTTINATVSDPSGVSLVILRYRVNRGDMTSEWQSACMTSTAADFYQLPISAMRLPSPHTGILEYRIEAFDAAGNRAQSAEYRLEVRVCP